MLMKHFMRTLILMVSLVSLAGCGPRIPAAKDFTVPAIGTPMPGGHEEVIPSDLPSGQSGALVVNQTGYPIQVAVNNTITGATPWFRKMGVEV